MAKRYWIISSGERLLITKMTNVHIKNCITFLERYHDNITYAMWNMFSFFNGEQAIDQLESDITQIEDHGFNDEAQDYIDTFKNELRKRKKQRKL